MHSDPIADMLTRIRNAQAVKKETVVLGFSKTKFNIAKILSDEKWLGKVEKIEDKNDKFNQLKIKLLYNNNQPRIIKLTRISKPGRRVYTTKDKLPIVLNNYGIAIVSTSKGLMTNVEAKKKNLGGEVICEIY
ncbi:30S ribosomal protein S8 [Candidatus Parcubacteria bacterium]|nr:30S ribosomal protein S8 [Patescibacteria group bacterium]MBU4482142.1 30S ribosomal protein S8 [Patescibacteria group bacterium]MCG2687073.1 30S ribosomal protein S8 [Candidatus Parcubacteria bacterium]